MPSNNKSTNPKDIDPKDLKKLKTRGKGTGRDYSPFIKVHEISSSGESVRILGATSGRIHHLLSGLELSAFLIFDWCRRTIDIREQYPIPIDDSLDICSQLGIKHPHIRGKLKVVTTDLLVDFEDKSELAIAVKPSDQLGNERTIEKLQIEKTYWENLGIDWLAFTEREISNSLRENLNWITPYLKNENLNSHQTNLPDIEDLLLRICKPTQDKVTLLCGKLDDQYQVEPGSHISALRHAVANRLIHVPIKKSFHSWRCSDLEIAQNCSFSGVNDAS